MAIGVLSHAKAGSADGDTVTAGPINTVGAHQIVVVVAQSTVVPILTDSEGNVWNDTITEFVGEGLFIGTYFIDPEDPFLTSAAHTFTATDAGGKPSICVAAFVGAKAPDQVTHNEDTGVEELALTPITPSADGALITTGIALDTFTADSIGIFPDISITDYVNPTATALGCALGWFEQPAAAAFTSTWNWTTAAVAINQAISFLAFGAAAGGAALRRNVCTWGRRTRGR